MPNLICPMVRFRTFNFGLIECKKKSTNSQKGVGTVYLMPQARLLFIPP